MPENIPTNQETIDKLNDFIEEIEKQIKELLGDKAEGGTSNLKTAIREALFGAIGTLISLEFQDETREKVLGLLIGWSRAELEILSLKRHNKQQAQS